MLLIDARALFEMVLTDATQTRWHFAWGEDLRLEGIVYPDTRIACLTREFALRATPGRVLKTAVHEAAHALDVETRGKSDHGKVWAALERQLKRKWGI